MKQAGREDEVTSCLWQTQMRSSVKIRLLPTRAVLILSQNIQIQYVRVREDYSRPLLSSYCGATSRADSTTSASSEASARFARGPDRRVTPSQPVPAWRHS